MNKTANRPTLKYLNESIVENQQYSTLQDSKFEDKRKNASPGPSYEQDSKKRPIRRNISVFNTEANKNQRNRGKLYPALIVKQKPDTRQKPTSNAEYKGYSHMSGSEQKSLSHRNYHTLQNSAAGGAGRKAADDIKNLYGNPVQARYKIQRENSSVEKTLDESIASN